jgi:hypothetical protein
MLSFYQTFSGGGSLKFAYKKEWDIHRSQLPGLTVVRLPSYQSRHSTSRNGCVLLSTVFALEHIRRDDCLLSNEEIGKNIDSEWVGGMLEELRRKQDKDSSKSLYKNEEFISPHLALETMLAELEPTWVHGEGPPAMTVCLLE